MIANKTPNPFVGLKPYSEYDSEIFFGREQEVENVLEILQKNKLVILSGASGSGKTSLIKAGLINRLKNGFLGQSGKDWSVAYFRPGIEPLLNLSQALSANGVLKINSKSNTTDQKYYSEVISNFNSLGIVEIFRRSEIFDKKNLLIVVDQLEDLYKYHKYFDFSTREDDNTLMDLIYRSVAYKNTAIYFLISIQTPYVTKLTSYTKLQKILSDSQYNIQNLDQQGIKQILDKTFYSQNINFSSSALDSMIETLREEIGFLPNFQFLLYKLYDKFIVGQDEKSLITEDDIDNLGGVSGSISYELESIYKESSEKDKNEMSSIFKSIFNPQKTIIQYENILSISEYTNIPIADLSRVINFYKQKLNEVLEVFEPVITGIPVLKDKPLNRNSILVLKYFDFVNWSRHAKWKREEEKDYENFKSFHDDAIKKNKGEVDYLKTPELESGIDWRDNPMHNKYWANKYDLNFDQTIDFINKSEQDDLRIKKEKSDKLDRERKKDKKYKRAGIVTSVVVFILLLISTNKYIQAEALKKEEIKAKNELNVTLIKEKEAREEANEEKNNAKKALTVAREAQKEANEEKNKAREALTAEEKARSEAEYSDSIANVKSKKSETLKDLIELKNDFNLLQTKLKTAAQEDDKDKIITLIDSSIVKQNRFNKLKKRDLVDAEEVGGDEGMLKLNQQILMAINKKEKYAQTSMLLVKNEDNSVRSFDIFNNQKIAYAGDRGIIKFFDINKKILEDSIVINKNNDINDRIRNLSYIDKNNLLVSTFSGKLFKVNTENITNQEPIPFFETNLFDIVDFFIDRQNNKQFLITLNKVIIFENYNKIKENDQYNNIKASYFTDSKLFIVSNGKVFVLEKDDKYYQIRFDGNSENLNVIDFIYVSENFLFLGDKNGNVLWYDYNYEDIKNLKKLKFNDKFKNHFASITKIFFDEDNNLLFTASLDNKIYRYDLSYEKQLIKNSITNLEGHEKWIWDMNTYINAEDKKMLITADENGNLLKWYVHPKDLLEEIELLRENYSNK